MFRRTTVSDGQNTERTKIYHDHCARKTPHKAGLVISLAIENARSVFLLTLVQVAIMLYTGYAQAGHTRSVDSPLPRRKFFERQIIAFAHVVDGQ